jgi:hypothetical protein
VYFVVCTLAVKKNQGRFRHVGSDHSLVSSKRDFCDLFHEAVSRLDNVASNARTTVIMNWKGIKKQSWSNRRFTEAFEGRV